MIDSSLPERATLTSVLNSLLDPRRYIRGMLTHVVNAGVDLKHVRVALGITGDGIVPNYAIYDAGLDHDAPDPAEDAPPYPRLLGAYRGSDHALMKRWDESRLGDRSWGDWADIRTLRALYRALGV